MNSYDLIVVGTGFASSFFLAGYFKRPENRDKRVLVLEAGPYVSHHDLLSQRRFLHYEADNHYATNNPDKPWFFSTAFGGGSNCWYGVTPRMLPEDFQLNSLYGVGYDWPISYEDLEEHYTQAERIMEISGGDMPYPMSSPYPLPPHRFSTIDQLLHKQYPKDFFHLPTARASKTSQRPQCCNNSICYCCPINSKFTILNGLQEIYQGKNIEVRYESPVTRLEVSQKNVQAVEFMSNGKIQKVSGDLVALGANAIFNPFILLKSGLDDGVVGTGICEQVGASVHATFDDVENLFGSTNTTGLGYNYARGSLRKTQGALLYQTVNEARNFSLEEGRWLNQFQFLFGIEDIPQKKNRVVVDPSNEFRPFIQYDHHSAYAQAAYDKIPDMVRELLAPLPNARIQPPVYRKTEYHIQCSTMMGTDPKSSVIDDKCIHHKVRNLLVLGSGSFPTASPANPSLTISALSLYAADKL